MSQMSMVASTNSSMVIVPSCGSPRADRSSGVRALSNRPLLATMIRSDTSRSTGLPGR